MLCIIIRFIHLAMKEYVKTARLHNRKKKEKNKESDPTEGHMMVSLFRPVLIIIYIILI